MRAMLANMAGAARALQPISRICSRRFCRACEHTAVLRRRFSFQGSYNKQGRYYGKGAGAKTAGGMMGKVLMYFLTATGAVVWAVQLGEVAVFYYFPDRWVTTRFFSPPCLVQQLVRRFFDCSRRVPVFAVPLLELLQVPRDHGARARRRT